MASVWRRLQRTRKRALRYRFAAQIKELQLECLPEKDGPSKFPERLLVSFLHRRRRYSFRARQWESSFSRPERTVLVWPEAAADSISFTTTLYQGALSEHPDDKEWTIVVEELLDKDRRRPLAAVPLNMRLFLSADPTNESSSELRLKLRVLSLDVESAYVVLVLSSFLVHESEKDSRSRSVSSSKSRDASRDACAPPLPNKNDLALADTVRGIHSDWKAAQKEDDDDDDDEDGGGGGRRDRPPPLPPHRTPEGKIVPSGSRPSLPSSIGPAAAAAAEPTPPPLAVPTSSSGGRSRLDRHDADVTTTDASSRVVDPVLKEQLARLPSAQFQMPLLDPSQTTAPSIPAAARRKASSSPRPAARTVDDAPSKSAPSASTPAIIPNEPLLDWAQRVTRGYPVRISDLTKSWKNGVALCAVIHSYQPHLIGGDDPTFNSVVDFSDSLSGNKSNLRRSLQAADKLGLLEVPDESYFLSPDRETIKRFLLALRRALEGSTTATTPGATSVDGGDPSRQSMYFAERNEMEDKVVAHIAQLQRDESTKRKEPNPSQKQPADSATSLKTPTRQRVQQLLHDTSLTSAESEGEEEKRRRYQVEARRMLEEARKGSITSQSSGSGTPSLRRTASQNSTGDLRKLELREVRVPIQTFRRRDPSPVLPRKNYDQPLLPALGVTTDLGSSKPGVALAGGAGMLGVGALDRVRRYGSMRSAELAEAMREFKSNFGYASGDESPSVTPRSAANVAGSQTTPTRKVEQPWERDLADVQRTTVEAAALEDQLATVEQMRKQIDRTLQNADRDGDEFDELLASKNQLLAQSAALIHRQEYYNLLERSREAIRELRRLQEKLDQATQDGDDSVYRRPDEKAKREQLVRDYMTAVTDRERVIQQLASWEEEVAPGPDDLAPVEFQRGQPVSASQRLFNWIRDKADNTAAAAQPHN